MVEHNQSQYYGNQYKFNGKELDAATGMYYYGARYYDPRLSIFISVDPLAEQTFEPYSYVGNNPINFIDPTGMSKEGGGDSEGGSWVSKAWNTVKSWFSGNKSIDKNEDNRQYSFYFGEGESEFLPENEAGYTIPVGVGIGGSSLISEIGASLASVIPVVGVLTVSATLTGDTRRDDVGEGYLYRNMRADGMFSSRPQLGQSANTLGIRPTDVGSMNFNEIISGSSSDGLSTTFGIGNYRKDFTVTPQTVRNYAPGKTKLFRIRIRDLAPLNLKPSNMGGTYFRITPSKDMKIEEFNQKIKETQNLWRIAPSNRR